MRGTGRDESEVRTTESRGSDAGVRGTPREVGDTRVTESHTSDTPVVAIRTPVAMSTPSEVATEPADLRGTGESDPATDAAVEAASRDLDVTMRARAALGREDVTAIPLPEVTSTPAHVTSEPSDPDRELAGESEGSASDWS